MKLLWFLAVFSWLEKHETFADEAQILPLLEPLGCGSGLTGYVPICQGAYDGITDDDPSYASIPNYKADKRGSISTPRDSDFHADLVNSGDDVGTIKIYPRRDCCADRYENYRVVVRDLVTNADNECTAIDDLSPSNVAALRDTGIRWSCPSIANGARGISILHDPSPSPGQYVQFTEIEVLSRTNTNADPIPLTNVRFTVEGDPSWGYVPVAIGYNDGITDDDPSYASIPNYNPANRGAMTSNMNQNFHADLVTPGDHVGIIKLFPRRDCCFFRYADYDVGVWELGTNNFQTCSAIDDLSEANVENVGVDTGLRWECPALNNGASTISVLYGRQNFVAFTELEVYGVVSVAPLPGSNYQQTGLLLRNYAPTMLQVAFDNAPEVIDATQTLDRLLSHGCWCAKLDTNAQYLQYLGGSSAVDELDEICKYWFKCRNCNDKLKNGSCNIEGNSSREMLLAGSFDLSYDDNDFQNTAICNNPADQCSDDTCVIDLHYITNLINFIDENGGGLDLPVEVTDQNQICSSTGTNPEMKRKCSGSAPYLRPVEDPNP